MLFVHEVEHHLLREEGLQLHERPLPRYEARCAVELSGEQRLVAVLRHGIWRHGIGEQLRVGKPTRIRKTGLHRTGHEAGDCDARALQFTPESVREAGDIGLRGVVDSLQGSRRARRSRGDVEHLAAPTRDEVGQEEFAEARRALDVHCDHGHVLLHGALAGKVALSAESCVVYEDVDLPAILLASAVDLLNVLGFREVCRYRVNDYAVPAFRFNSLFIKLFLAPADKDEVAATGCMNLHEAGPESAVTSCDECRVRHVPTAFRCLVYFR